MKEMARPRRQGEPLAAPVHTGGIEALRRSARRGRLREDRGRRSLRRGHLLHAGLRGTRRLHRLHEPRGEARSTSRTCGASSSSGARVIKVDFGEQAPLDGVYHDGTPGHRMHNLYPLLYNQAVAEVTVETTGESIIWARSAWAGSQRYPLHWGGDSSANWHNLGPQIAGGLSLGLSRLPVLEHGHRGIRGRDGRTAPRALDAGRRLLLASPHPRHRRIGSSDKCDPETLRLCRDVPAAPLPSAAVPVGHGARLRRARSLPVSRALVLEYPDDPTTWSIGRPVAPGRRAARGADPRREREPAGLPARWAPGRTGGPASARSARVGSRWKPTSPPSRYGCARGPSFRWARSWTTSTSGLSRS